MVIAMEHLRIPLTGNRQRLFKKPLPAPTPQGEVVLKIIAFEETEAQQDQDLLSYLMPEALIPNLSRFK